MTTVTKKRNTPTGNAIGRPRVLIATDLVLNAWDRYHSVNRAAKELGITPGTCFARLKEAGVCPLGMSRSERGQLGYQVKMNTNKNYAGCPYEE